MTDLAKQGGLWAAVAAVQAEAPTLPKDKTNPHFKSRYTALDTIVELVGPLLEKHGLVWTTLPAGTHDEPTLSYQLAHVETGESITGSMPLLLDKRNAQGMGSALTYARRYAVTAVLNLVADEDDDGTAAARTAAAPQMIGEDAKSEFVDALKALTGADDRDTILGLWRRIRGDLDRPSVTVARAVLEIEKVRQSQAGHDPEAERLRDDARRGYEAICKVTPGGAAIEYFPQAFTEDLARAGHDVGRLNLLIGVLDGRLAEARAKTAKAAA